MPLIGERSMETSADVALDLERRKLLALIAGAPHSELGKIRSAVEAILSNQSTAKTHDKDLLGIATLGSVAKDLRGPAHQQFRSIASICDGRRSKNGKPKLPFLPAELRWPLKKYSKQHKKSGCTIEQFLQCEWSHLVAAGYGELRWLRMIDPSAARAVAYFESRLDSNGERRRLPDDIRFLTEKEVTDRKLARGLVDAIKGEPRLALTVASRLRRGAAVPI